MSHDSRGGRPVEPGDGRTAGERLAGALHHRGGRPGRRSVVASVLLHVVLVAAVLVSGGLLAEDLPEFETMRIHLVSPPPVALGEPTPAPAREAVIPVEPEQQPEPPQPDPEPVKEPEARPPEPKVQEKQATPPPPEEKKPEEKPATGTRPDPNSPGGENINLVQDGQEFPYPAYLENIVTQLYRYMRWDGADDLAVGLIFAIERDGTVTGVDIQRRSSNPRFDLAAVNAVNVAARNGEFGALPQGYVNERLWVRFTFLPQK